MNNRWGLVKDYYCQRCGGALEIQLYPDGEEDILCILCGRREGNIVPAFIYKEIEMWKDNGARKAAFEKRL